MATKRSNTTHYIDPMKGIANFWTAKPAAPTATLDEAMNSDVPPDEHEAIPGKQCCAVRDGIACERNATVESASGQSFYCSQHGHCGRCKRSAAGMVLWKSRGFYVCPCIIEEDQRMTAKDHDETLAKRRKTV